MQNSRIELFHRKKQGSNALAFLKQEGSGVPHL
jgi:hypothetical protein